MIFVDIVPAGSGQFSAVIKGRIRATGASEALALVAAAKTCRANITIFCPKAMAHCMKAGDITSRNDANSVAAPAYTSNRR